MNTGLLFEKEIYYTTRKMKSGFIYKLNEDKYLRYKMPFDYVGMINGKTLCFDAKSTQNKTSFPISNIKQHQIENLQDVANKGAYAFVFIKFRMLERYFILDIKNINKRSNKASFTIKDLEENGIEIKMHSFEEKLKEMLGEENEKNKRRNKRLIM